MENKKFVKILLNDMTDLEEMIAEVKTRGQFDILEMEILHTRAKGILQLLQLLNGMEPAGVAPQMPVQEKTDIEPQESQEEAETKTEPVRGEDEKAEIQNNVLSNETPGVKMKEKEETESDVEKEEPKTEVEEQPQHTEEPEVEKEIAGPEPVEDKNSGDVELEEEEVLEANHRLGDSFLKGKSVNDIINDQNKLEFKLSNRPVVSIQAAIGINDRFQYMRELFDGSSEKFARTVADLDRMNSINEAVKYLQQNFKWKKNETSLKFVNLIKRRFAND